MTSFRAWGLMFVAAAGLIPGDRALRPTSAPPRSMQAFTAPAGSYMPERKVGPACSVCGELLSAKNVVDGSRECRNTRCPSYGKKIWFFIATLIP